VYEPWRKLEIQTEIGNKTKLPSVSNPNPPPLPPPQNKPFKSKDPMQLEVAGNSDFRN